jgi:hypothetical protein
MNILVDSLPAAVEIDNQEYALDTDFRTCLRVILAFEDPELADVEKQAVLLDNLYPELPDNVSRAFELGIKFLNGGDDAEEEEKEEGLSLRLYSFKQDANFIFAAFRQTHGIDLESIEYLHWWKFLALFMDLGPDTTFCHLVGLRKRLKTGKATKEEQLYALEMAEVVDLDEPDRRTLEEKAQEDEFLRLVAEAERRREQKKEA